ncbi:hypothetical protein MNBD_NITROSPINAE02-252 [hydrothermal vent metagenome]|uniref:Mutator family transposase n=1 Tax=hydrothermal vent metagenome TaxID=652676 RepID=A0A3B1C482_9ZZZZ
MSKDNLIELETQDSFEGALTDVLRNGARRLLGRAIDAEVEEFLRKHQAVLDTDGRRMIVRNGYHHERDIQTGIGGVKVKATRVRDLRSGEDDPIRFTSRILPPYLRRTKSLEDGYRESEQSWKETLLDLKSRGLKIGPLRHSDYFLSAQNKWQKLNGSNLLAEVIDGVNFVDGIREKRISA